MSSRLKGLFKLSPELTNQWTPAFFISQWAEPWISSHQRSVLPMNGWFRFHSMIWAILFFYKGHINWTAFTAYQPHGCIYIYTCLYIFNWFLRFAFLLDHEHSWSVFFFFSLSISEKTAEPICLITSMGLHFFFLIAIKGLPTDLTWHLCVCLLQQCCEARW